MTTISIGITRHELPIETMRKMEEPLIPKTTAIREQATQ